MDFCPAKSKTFACYARFLCSRRDISTSNDLLQVQNVSGFCWDHPQIVTIVQNIKPVWSAKTLFFFTRARLKQFSSVWQYWQYVVYVPLASHGWWPIFPLYIFWPHPPLVPTIISQTVDNLHLTVEWCLKHKIIINISPIVEQNHQISSSDG
jgi:hypothetical protein